MPRLLSVKWSVIGFVAFAWGASLFLSCAQAEAADRDPLVKLLIKKGVITEEEVRQMEAELVVEEARLRAEAAQPQEKKAAPVVPPGLEERVAKLERSVETGPVVRVGHGALRMGGLFQSHLIYDAGDNDRARIRRTEIKFSGDILEGGPIHYTVMLDPAQVNEDVNRNNPLQDAFFTIDPLPFLAHHKLDLGQYKTPLGEEGPRSSSKLDTIERAFISRQFGDVRDIGAMVTGAWPYVTYQLGVFNGSGQNRSDSDDGKDVAGRLVLRPLKEFEPLDTLEVGLSGYHRFSNERRVGEKRRLGYDARYTYGPFALKGEYLSGQDSMTEASGWYTQASYRFLKDWEAVAKFEDFDANERSQGKESDATVGLNYFIDKYHAKAQLNYIHKEERHTQELDNDQVIAALQVAF